MTFRFRITPFLDFIAYVRSMNKMNNAGRLTQRNSAQSAIVLEAQQNINCLVFL